MTRSYDAVVIGASVGGLAAAGFLAKAGARVLLLEERLAAPEPGGTLFALDPAMIAALKLPQHGLRFMRRDLAPTGWDEEEGPLILTRERRASARALRRLSDADAQAWDPFQAEIRSRARALRRWWWNPHAEGAAADMLWRRADRAAFARECVSGAEDFLARYFESPRLIGMLLHDAVTGGFAPSEPGSALALIWRAAQEMAGLQGATALAEPGTLMAALKAAVGAEIRMGALVTEIRVARGAMVGVRLADGEEIAARVVLSSLPRAVSEGLVGLERLDADSLVGEAQIVLTLAEGLALQAGRAVIALPPESYADAYEAARAGRLPSVLPLACVAETPRRLSVTLPLMPVLPQSGWDGLRVPLAAKAVKSLSRHIPGLAAALTGVTVTPPRPRPRATLAQLLAPAAARAATRVPGLYLCGDDAEPLPCVSGRAGCFAAYFTSKALQ